MPSILVCQEKVFAHFGIPWDLAEFRRVFSPNWRKMYEAAGIPPDRYEEGGAIWNDYFDPSLMQPFPGVVGALERLAVAGYRLGLVTGGDRDGIDPMVRRLGLEGLLAVRVYAEDTRPHGKPHPAPLLRALDLAGGADPRDAVYVGDAPDDMRMAAAVGTRGVGIVSIVATAEELLAAGAGECADSTAEWVDRFLDGGDALPSPRPDEGPTGA
jgi:phosphoglycolate phosphatase-like HAD superfamily hydrolase